jgi:hypothetical protein
VNSMDLSVSTPDRIFWNLRECMETGKSPCAWFCNPRVEDSGICVRNFISSSGGILGVLVLGRPRPESRQFRSPKESIVLC